MTPFKGIDNAKVVKLLNRILDEELAGVVRYTHYSFIFGYNRIPIVSWFRSEADGSLGHARQAGEMLTHIGEHPSLAVGHLLLVTHKHDINQILEESLEAERTTLTLYKALLEEVQGRSTFLEEYARKRIFEEELHEGEVDTMRRHPGAIKPFAGGTPSD